ncbi:SDR family oxidoreductase [Kocuria aegyptia]|uniref:Complex I NDUFA9 subunit family protein n=1 Tax=Kocuria aegyptia TaxID=330943 RepID=A0ABN2K946_9MICC
MVEAGWATGPVAITGADGQVGTALQHRLASLPNDVRALGRHDDLAVAFRDASAVVHLAGTLRPKRPNTYAGANLDTVAATIAALEGSVARRVVFLSYLDADPASANPYLRAKGQAEQQLRTSGVPAVIFRAAHIYGPPQAPGPTVASMISRGGKPVPVLGPGTQRYAWISREDVAEALVCAALDPATPDGTFELAGPQSLSVDEFVAHVNAADVRIRHLPAGVAHLLGRVVPSLPGPLVDVMLRDCLPTADPEQTAKLFGLTLRRVDEIWQKQL